MNKDGMTLRRLLTPFEYDKKKITKGDGRLYQDAILLKEGEYSDSITMSPIVYTKEQLKAIPNHISRKSDYFPIDDDRIYLNMDHRPNEVLTRIGYVPNIYFLDNALRGDIYLHCLTRNSNDVRRLIDAGYVSHLSVEIMTKDSYSVEDDKVYAEDIVLVGLAVVLHPACPDSRIMPED